jgi:predicted dinucleotide-binding enzyme
MRLGRFILLVCFLHSSFAMSFLSSKTIAVVGGGSVGSTLANALQGKAKSVVIAARNPEKTKAQLAEKGLDLTVESLARAISSADILILATPSVQSDEALQGLAQSLGDVSNKVVIDATNPLSEFANGLEVRWAQGTSGGEVLQEALPTSFVYKAFNTIGVEHMADPTGKDMLICGSPDQKELVQAVVAAVGYKPYYVGPIRYARNLEAMAELWIHCGIPPLPAANLGRDWTFGVSGNPSSSS